MSICLRKRVARMCLFCLLITSLCGVGFAMEGEQEEAGGTQAVDYDLIPVYIDGIRASDGFMLDATTYVPVREFSEAMGRDVEVRWDEETETMTISLEREVGLLMGKASVLATVGETELLPEMPDAEVPVVEDPVAEEALSAEKAVAEEKPELGDKPAAAGEPTAGEEIVFEEETVPLAETAAPAEAEIELRSLTVTVRADDAYIAVNERYLYAPNGVRFVDGLLMAPIRTMAAAFGLEVVWHEDTRSVSLDSTELQVLEHAAGFYDEEDLYWLSHIIHAESGNQPLEGMIGVGNVVLNRVADPSCPDTVYDVIFDRRYGVQFSPTETGTVYDEPNELSVIAAKLCLEGYQVAGDSLFFLNPEIGISSWFVNTRTYVATIGDHVFYA